MSYDPQDGPDSIGIHELRHSLDRGYFVALLITRTPWLHGLHTLNTDMSASQLVSLYRLTFRIAPVGSKILFVVHIGLLYLCGTFQPRQT
jgi:hypothetical protein